MILKEPLVSVVTNCNLQNLSSFFLGEMIEVVPFPIRLAMNLTQPSIHGKSMIGIRRRSRAIVASSSSSSSSSSSYNQTVGVQMKMKRVFLLDVNPLCYEGSKPSLECFSEWVSLLFRQVSLSDPVVAVIDGERGSEQRRQLLPSYKAHRLKRQRQYYSEGHVGRWQRLISEALSKCNVPLLRMEGEEADDVIATLASQALQKGCRAVIASPDKDFKQLLSEDVQIVMPLPELRRWSFYTLKHYASQYKCEPCSELSLRCILGDEVDGVPGIQQVAPGFGRKTALKLLKKHGSLENLLATAAVRSVGKQYAQEALLKHADYLRRNYQLLALRTDVNVTLEDHWLRHRDTTNDASITTLAHRQNL